MATVISVGDNGANRMGAVPQSLRSSLNSAKIYLLSFPAGTRVVLATCIIVHIIGVLTGPWFNQIFCLLPGAIYGRGQLHRVVTHALMHHGWLHLLLNMASLVPLGSMVEEKIGTLQFLLLQFHSALLGGIVYLILTSVAGLSRYYNVCVLGYSGVLLTLLVVFVYKYSTSEVIKIFGFIHVPNTLAPWVCLLLFQLIPHVSFFGHLAGILVGYGLCAGGMRVLLLQTDTLESVAHRLPCSLLARLPGFVKAPQSTGGLPSSAATNNTATTANTTSDDNSNSGRFPGVGRQLVPTAVRGASLYEETEGADVKVDV